MKYMQTDFRVFQFTPAFVCRPKFLLVIKFVKFPFTMLNV